MRQPSDTNPVIQAARQVAIIRTAVKACDDLAAMRVKLAEARDAAPKIAKAMDTLTDQQLREWRTWTVDEDKAVKAEIEKTASAVLRGRKLGAAAAGRLTPGMRSGVDVRSDDTRRNR